LYQEAAKLRTDNVRLRPDFIRLSIFRAPCLMLHTALSMARYVLADFEKFLTGDYQWQIQLWTRCVILWQTQPAQYMELKQGHELDENVSK